MDKLLTPEKYDEIVQAIKETKPAMVAHNEIIRKRNVMGKQFLKDGGSVAEFNKQHPRPAKSAGARKHKFCKFQYNVVLASLKHAVEAPARVQEEEFAEYILGKTFGKEHHVSPKVYKYLYDECEKAFEGEKIMPWSFIAKDDAVLTLWPGMKVRKLH